MEKREKLVLILSFTLITLAAGFYVLMPKILNSFKPHNPNFIGLSTHTTGDVKIRFGDSITWRKLEKKEKIFANSYLFTGPNSSSTFAFLDKSTIKLDANSLVSLDFQVQGQDGTVPLTAEGMPTLKIGLVEGKADVRLRPNSQVKSIHMDQSVVNIGNDAAIIQLEGGKDNKIAVMDGQVNVTSKGQTHEVKAGEKAVSNADEEELKKEEVPDELMEEMKKLALENDRLMFEEEKKKREFFYLIKQMFAVMLGEESQ